MPNSAIDQTLSQRSDQSPVTLLADVGEHRLRSWLRQGRVFESGPFLVRLHANISAFATTFRRLYAEARYFETSPAEVIDFHIALKRPLGPRRWYRRQVVFELDGYSPFAPFPLDHAYPLFEWGLNWAIGSRAHQYLMFHSAVVERNGKAIILPAVPGSGKSTLCAALMASGWRLLSDEFGIIRMDDGMLLPLPRPIPLKNASIPVIKSFATDWEMGPVYPKTRKGDVCHMKPSADSIRQSSEPAIPSWVIFPRYQAGADASLRSLPASERFARLSLNSFNYQLKAQAGFDQVARMISECEFYTFKYDDLTTAVATLDRLADNSGYSAHLVERTHKA